MVDPMAWVGSLRAPYCPARAHRFGVRTHEQGLWENEVCSHDRRSAPHCVFCFGVFRLVDLQPASAGRRANREEIARAEAALAGSAPTAGRMKPTATVLLGSPELTSGISGNGPLTVAEIKAWLALPSVHEVLKVELPLGLSAGHPKGLEANPLTRGKIELGRQLYFDARLSSDGTVSCASCHAPEEAWVKHSQFGIGIRGQVGGRNSPPSFNRILSDAQFWDGRADSLEAQAKGPIANPIEMGNTHAQAVAKIAAIEGYRLEFAAIFGNSGVTIDNIAKAIASFERSVVTGSSPFDYYEALRPFAKMSTEDLDEMKQEDKPTYAKYARLMALAKEHPMSASAIRGRDLFFSERVNCSACHVVPT